MITGDDNMITTGETPFYNVQLSERDAWSAATTAVLFNGLGMLLLLAIVRKVPGVSAKPAGMSAIVALVLLIGLSVGRKTPTVKWASIIYSVNTAAVLGVLLTTNLQFATFERNWVPFQAMKLGSLVAAMVAPGFWVGLVSILAYCIGAVVQFEFFFPPEIKSRVAAIEPWPMLAFTMAAVFALFYRFRQAKIEQEIARIQAQNFAIRQLADAFLNIRDLMNTPLQVIELSIHLLRRAEGSNKPLIDHIEHSMRALAEINTMLIRHEKEIEWRTKRS